MAGRIDKSAAQNVLDANITRGAVALKVTVDRSHWWDAELSPPDAVRMARAVAQDGTLGKGHSTLVKWILDAMDSTKQVPFPVTHLKNSLPPSPQPSGGSQPSLHQTMVLASTLRLIILLLWRSYNDQKYLQCMLI